MMDENSAGCASEAGHVGRYECRGGGMIDEWLCSCGWKSGPYFDGAEFAEAAFKKHLSSSTLLPAPMISQDVEPTGVVCSHDNCNRRVDCGPDCLNTNERSQAVNQDEPAPLDLDSLQEAYVLLTEPVGMTKHLRERMDAAQRMVILSLPAIIAELNAARTPAKVTPEMIAEAEEAVGPDDGWTLGYRSSFAAHLNDSLQGADSHEGKTDG